MTTKHKHTSLCEKASAAHYKAVRVCKKTEVAYNEARTAYNNAKVAYNKAMKVCNKTLVTYEKARTACPEHLELEQTAPASQTPKHQMEARKKCSGCGGFDDVCGTCGGCCECCRCEDMVPKEVINMSSAAQKPQARDTTPDPPGITEDES